MGKDTSESKRKGRGNKRHGTRYRARARAVDLLFEGELRDYDPVALAAERNDLAREFDDTVRAVPDYTSTIIAGVAESLDAIDDTLQRYLTSDWELNRIPAVDRAILRVACWELIYNTDVPDKIAVVEGTELAFQYSGKQASRYINAMMDRMASEADDIRREVAALTADDDKDEPLVASGNFTIPDTALVSEEEWDALMDGTTDFAEEDAGPEELAASTADDDEDEPLVASGNFTIPDTALVSEEEWDALMDGTTDFAEEDAGPEELAAPTESVSVASEPEPVTPEPQAPEAPGDNEEPVNYPASANEPPAQSAAAPHSVEETPQKSQQAPDGDAAADAPADEDSSADDDSVPPVGHV